MIHKLKEQNTSFPIYTCDNPAFKRYGKLIDTSTYKEYRIIMENRAIPNSGNIYIGLDPELTSCQISSEIASKLYGGLPIQVGFCNGNNSKLNALEYHKSSEVNIAITDLVLFLGDIRDINLATYSTTNIEAFFLPAGTACELYATTLHFAPCRVSDGGFKSIIILPLGTNDILETLPTPACDEEKLLWLKNKWLIAHPESIPASKGAHVGITGPNIELKY